MFALQYISLYLFLFASRVLVDDAMMMPANVYILLGGKLMFVAYIYIYAGCGGHFVRTDNDNKFHLINHMGWDDSGWRLRCI